MSEWSVDTPQVIEIDEPVREIAVRIVGGHLDVVPIAAGDGATARVEVATVEGDPLRVTMRDGVLTIRHEQVSWTGWLGFAWSKAERRRADVAVAVPAGVAARIAVVSAGTLVAGLDGEVHVRTVSGGVTLDGVTGEVRVESVSGDVEARDLTGPVHATSVSGDLSVVSGRGERVTAKSVSGDVALDLAGTAPADIDVTTVSGDVLVRLPQDAGLALDVTTTSGEVSCALDGASVQRRPGSRTLTGSVGDGRGALKGRTVSGRVAVLAKDTA